jgi:hypothetical protein
MGVSPTIGRFFVDRKLPENNSFWKGRLLYIGFGNGYVSITVFYYILLRRVTEELKCIRSLLKNRVQDQNHYNSLNRYLDQPVLKPLGPFGLVHHSLNRADVFLYVLCDLPLSDEQWKLAIRYWYALHPSYLIMDDIRDYAKDKEEGEENVVIDLGDGPIGFERTFEMLHKNSETIKEINPLLAQFLLDYEEELRGFVSLKA